MKKSSIPLTIRTILTGIASMFCCILLLTVTACSPQSAIQKQSEISADYFKRRESFAILIGDYVNSIQDNYSDTVLCDIIYCIDTAHPFDSVIRAKYAQGDNENAKDGYLSVVEGRSEANLEYGRYWHGTMVFLRPLLMLVPIQMIRLLFGTVCMAIQIFIFISFFRNGRQSFAVCYLLSLLLIEPWMFFASLEYSTTFLTASVAELVVLLQRSKREDAELMPLFAVIGVVTCFVDFLTTETMTFTLPMLLVLMDGTTSTDMKEKRSVTDGIRTVVKNGLCWLGGYAGMFALKMVLLFSVAGGDTVRESLSEGMFRIGGQVNEANVSIAPVVSFGRQLSGAIWHNLACLYPTHTGLMEAGKAWIPTMIIVGIGLAAVYLLRDHIAWNKYVPMGFLAILPYVRFLALSNHAYVHFFITYRAQMVTAAVFLLFIYENALKMLKKQ